MGGSVAAPKKPKKLTRKERLEAARDLAWKSLQDVDPDKRAGLLKEFRFILAELDDIEPVQSEPKGTPLDELAKRRAARQSGAKSSGKPKVGEVD